MKKLFFTVLTVTLGTSLQAQHTIKDALKNTENERYEDAKKDFESLITSDPTSVDNLYYFGNYYQILGDNKKAVEMWQKAGALNPEDKLSQVSMAKAIYFGGDTTTAAQQFCATIKKTKSKNAQVLLRVAETYYTGPIKNLKLAEGYLKQTIALEPKNVEALSMLGDVLLAQSAQNVSAATAQYNAALQVEPSNAALIAKKAMIYLGVKNYQLANDEFIKAETANPNFAPAYRQHAELNMAFAKYNNAADLYKKALAINPTNEARYRLATALFAAAKYSEAMVELNTLESNGYSNAYTKRFIAYSLYETNTAADEALYQKALMASDEFFKVVESDKIIGDDYKYRANILVKLKQEEKAIAEFEKAATLDSDKGGDYLTEIAKLYGKTKNYVKIIETYKKKETTFADKMSPNDLFDFGRAYYFNNQYVESEQQFAKLIEKAPSFPNGYFWSARAKDKQDLADVKVRKYLAKDMYETYLTKLTEEDKAKAKSNMIEASKYLGDYYVNSKEGKDFVKAKVYWTTVQTLEPNDPQAKAFFTMKQ
ncbi:MAG: tetratricopeptide repeat protein [Fluviicola sp.]